jgi:hypothetical protein
MQEICKSKEPLWVDHFLEMVINIQEDISIILTNSFSSIDTFCNEKIAYSHLVVNRGDNISD